MKADPSISAIVFDLDDTLVNSRAAYAHALATTGIAAEGEAFARARRRVKDQLPPGHVAARNRLLYFKAMLEEEGGFSASAALELMTRYERALGEHLAAQWRALNRRPLIERLGREHRLLLLTNENTRTQLVKLQALDPTGALFPIGVTSEEIGVEKPHADALAHALARLGVAAELCAMVGDDVEADIRPAVALGMTAVLTTEFTSSTVSAPSGASCIRALDELEVLFP
jgi:putative hydrolase of the HAD superfamily